MQSLVGVCVLIVEDEPIVALDLASTLEDAGADVVGPAFSLEQAERLSDNPNIAVAVLDIRLGNRTVTPIASKLYNRGVAIIFHTGHGAANFTNQWPDSIILRKPARTDDLLKAVLSLLKTPESVSAI